MSKKITKSQIATFVRNKLKTNEQWAMAALLKIYEFQTADEKAVGQTHDYNNVGFSGVDGEIFSSFAKQYKERGWLSPKQKAIVMKRIHKYTRQIIQVSDGEKLMLLINKSK